MFLKRLEAFGFKSFADKVLFDFEPGFTCLVGPNGCGKSNVVDAVKWVLGEQSAKSLRGGEMLDVIFNGSANRKPLNFCEVTLTFDNASGKLPLGSPEVSVTRRLYRSGDSEYLINKALCRLRDIRELFFDTGIGTSSYSIIEQNRIGQLLEANAKERRTLFEEAAGIHKYKERKKIALRKLERVEQNLARLNDVLAEIERNMRAVSRQSEKARKAKELSDQCRQLRLDLLLHDFASLQTAAHETEGALSAAQTQVQTLTEQFTQASAATLSEQEAMSRLDQELARAQTQYGEAKAGLAGLEENLKSDQRACEEMATEAERARQAAQAGGERAAAVAHERERAELDHSQVRAAAARVAAYVEMLSGVIASDEAARDAIAQELEAARRACLDLLGRRTQAQEALAQAEATTASLEYRIRKTRAEAEKVAGQLLRTQQEATDARARLAQLQQRRETLETEQSAVRSSQAQAEHELQALSGRAQELRTQLEACRSRLAVLEDLNVSGEGLSPGVRACLTTLRTAGLDGGDLCGLAADCLSVDRRLEKAVEAALGSQLECLVAGTAATAVKLLERLCEEGLGRATFLALDRLRTALPHPSAPGTGFQAPGCLGRASELVTCEARFKPVAEALLGETLVYETVDDAEAARRREGPRARWRRVCLDGTLLEPSGAVSGGRDRYDRQGLLGRRNEIARLETQLDELELKVQANGEEFAGVEKRAQQLAQDDERLTAELASLNASAMELKSLLAAIARDETRSQEEQHVAASELHEIEAEGATHAARLTALRQELGALKDQDERASAEASSLSRELAKCEEALARRRPVLEELRRDASTLAVRTEAAQRQLQALSAAFAERRDEADREARRAAALEQRRQQTAASAQEKEARGNALAHSLVTLEADQRRAGGEKEAAKQRFEEARGKERALSQQLEAARQQKAQAEGQHVEVKLRLDARAEQARNEFKIEASEELSTRGGPPQPPSDAAAQAEALQERLQRLGPVNMYALEEQKSLEERFEFLKAQSVDLESARASLRDVTARINKRSRKQFQDTFDAVRGHFQEIFRKLFGGGKADLLLEETEDILEAGIEIVARPPGKEPRSIMQLSGGEKAMCTIALLFAVFRSRPAPFCLLDEVDAPLDEANVDRFNLILREFMDRSQFLVITHNKKTMSYADVLYGITMPEPGVSKRIAIKYAEIEKHLPMEQIEAQAQAMRSAMLAAPAPNPAKDAPEEVPAVAGAEAPVEASVEAEAVAAGGGGGAGA